MDHDKNVVGLLLDSLEVEHPVGQTPGQVSMFINQFMDVEGDFPEGDSECWDGSIPRTSTGGRG